MEAHRYKFTRCQRDRLTVHVTANCGQPGLEVNKKPRYRKDNRAMRPIGLHECPENCMYKRKISRRLRKNLHITILSLIGGEIIFEVFQSHSRALR